ncbi:subtilisin family serine protease [Actinoplanes tereljensis]|uniref:carboxypeptidase regulatory-like domain-containing protein n=1 Tax=Paractinoplanes tereljensis TaxID=571912 RepID=UPI001943505A|nr:carboxypeptidase regulatory-like domain-containing protein [Actinoplanes tereljensis]
MRSVVVLLLILTGVAVPAAATQAKAVAEGKRADVLVELREHADLSGARQRTTHGARVAYGQKSLTETAARTQRGVVDALQRRGAKFRSLWIVNAVAVTGADAALVAELAARPEVKSVRAVRTFAVPKPTRSEAVAAAASVEWNVASIGADRVWSDYGTRGEGIVVASIDTGVQFDHPALVEHYRGNLGGGVFQHRYNWFDPYGQCGLDVGPCDSNGHGTHTMGTMVGDDGDANHIGVAPGARWMAARGCDGGGGCSTLGLLLAGQWLMTPLDEAYGNPRPDLAPHVINNSWGSSVSDPFFADMVHNWIAVGIMPVFSAGNDGPYCGSVGSPADYAESYTVGAYGSTGAIASFSSRGATGATVTKPDVAAPGVSIRSSINGSRYDVYDGTSMAGPHVAGAVALLWSAAPSLIGNIAATRQLLDDSAVDVADTTCGGNADDNAVWGEGRMDVYAAVGRAPRGATGTLTGVVRSGGTAAAGVRVHVAGSNRIDRVANTDATGRYTMALPSGSYRIDVSGFGYLPATPPDLTIAAGQTTTVDVTLAGLARHTLSGVVRDTGGVPAPGISMRLLGTPLAAVATGADGRYVISGVPAGSYTLTFGAGRCLAAGTRLVTVDGDETVDLNPSARLDAAGYQCQRSTAAYVAGSTVLALTGDDESQQVTLPFAMPFYGGRFSTAWVATNGFLTFDRGLDNSINREVPNASPPNSAVFALWDDLVVDASASVRTATLGTAPSRRFVVEWRNVTFYDDGSQRATFSVELHEQGGITVHYGDLTGPLARGAAASVGIENEQGSIGLEYSLDTETLTAGTAVEFHTSGTIRGTVTKPDGSAAAGARVQAVRGDALPVTTTVAADGTYWLPLPLGTYTVDISLATFGTNRGTVVLDTDGETVVHDVRLTANERTVSGVVRDDLGNPIEGARVRLVVRSLPSEVVLARTGADGRFRFEKIPETDLNSLLYANVTGCMKDGRTLLEPIIGGDVTADVIVYSPTGVYEGADGFGYQCRVATAQPVTAATPLAVTATWDTPPTAVALPFAFPFYGSTYTTAYVSGYGYVTFEPQTYQSTSNDCLGNGSAGLFPYWETLTLDASSQVVTGVTGTAPNRRFTISWRNVLLPDGTGRATFDAILGEDGRATFEYPVLPDNATARGGGVTVGIAAPGYGGSSLEYLCRQDRLRPGGALDFLAPGYLTGTVTDQGTGTPVAGATVQLIRNEHLDGSATTDTAGRFTARAPLGSYTVDVTHDGHFPWSRSAVPLTRSDVSVRQDVALIAR